jgi:capsid portal protein
MEMDYNKNNNMENNFNNKDQEPVAEGIDFAFSQEIDNTVEAPVFKEDRNKNKDIVPYVDKEGKNYPDKLLYDFNNCSLHNAIIISKVFQDMGKGFIFSPTDPNAAVTEDFLHCVNEDEEDLNEIGTKCAYDLEIFGAFALQIIFSKDFSRIAQIKHMDWSKLRVSKVNEDGKIPGYYYSFDWNDIGKKVKKQFIPIYNPMGAKEQAKAIEYAISVSDTDAVFPVKITETSQLFVYQQYRPGTFYYPLPKYVGALSSIESNLMAALYGVNSWKNGMNADYHVTFIGNYTADAKKEIAKKFYKMHTSTAAVRKPIISFAKDKDSAVIITPVGNKTDDTGYININEFDQQNILTGHRITSPLLMGIKEAGQLGASQELQDAQTIFFETVIQPTQFEICKAFNKVLAYNELAELSIDPIKFTFGDLAKISEKVIAAPTKAAPVVPEESINPDNGEIQGDAPSKAPANSPNKQ